MTGAVQALMRNANKLAVSLSATAVSRTSRYPIISSPPVTGTPSKGTAPYTYAWTVGAVSRSSGTGVDAIVATDEHKATTSFAMSTADRGVVYTAPCYLTVTDSLGHIAVSQIVTVTLERTS